MFTIYDPILLLDIPLAFWLRQGLCIYYIQNNIALLGATDSKS